MDSVTLFEETKAAFARFKTDGNRCHYPNDLKNDALKLLSHYSESTLSAALGVTRVSLSNWRKDKDQPTKPSPTFLTFDLDEDKLIPKAVDPTIAFTVHLPHQLSLSLPEQSVKKAIHFIHALMKEFDR